MEEEAGGRRKTRTPHPNNDVGKSFRMPQTLQNSSLPSRETHAVLPHLPAQQAARAAGDAAGALPQPNHGGEVTLRMMAVWAKQDLVQLRTGRYIQQKCTVHI